MSPLLGGGVVRLPLLRSSGRRSPSLGSCSLVLLMLVLSALLPLSGGGDAGGAGAGVERPEVRGVAGAPKPLRREKPLVGDAAIDPSALDGDLAKAEDWSAILEGAGGAAPAPPDAGGAG
eukprot:COSAG04_NODE_9339_length_872_cov_1.692109_2_plen_119_part_01